MGRNDLYNPAEMIYFDNNATTQPLPEVVEAVARSLRDSYANPSSVHRFGQTVRHQIECARSKVAELVGASPKEIVFTASGTESINLAVKGLLAPRPGKRRVVTTAVEHSAMLRVKEQLEAQGSTVETVGVDGEGRLDEAEWSEKLTDDTALASIIHVNNETGVIFDIPGLARVAADRGIPVHVDAVQSAGKLPIDVSTWPVQLVSIAGHKFHGPKGAGALYVRRRTRLEPLIAGGTQERLVRGGTEAVADIIGLGVAAEIARRDCEQVATKVAALRDAFEAGVRASVHFAHVNAAGAPRIHNTSNIAFEQLEAEAILLLLSEAGICASAGAACSSGSLEPSHVLTAMGIPEPLAHGAIRFSFSRFNTRAEIDRALAVIPDLLSRLTVLTAR